MSFSIPSNSEMELFRLQGDPMADELIASLLSNGFPLFRDPVFQRGFRNGAEMPAHWPEELKSFYNEIASEANNISDSVFENGSRFFDRHAQAILLVLGLYSLPYCYAGAKGAQVLYHSKRIRENPGERLLETADFVFSVSSPGAFSQLGNGIHAIFKTRLTHAMVRQQLVRSDFNREQNGLPINQEDMAGTNLAFSFITLRGLRKLGIGISQNEAQDFLLMWNAIGHLMGLKEELIPLTLKESKYLDMAIADRQFKTSKEGIELTQILIDYVDSMEDNNTVRPSTLMKFLLGPELATMLGQIPNIQDSQKLERLLKITGSLTTFQLFPKGNRLNARRAFLKQKSQLKAK